MTRAAKRRAHSNLQVDQENAGGARGRLGGNCGEDDATTRTGATVSATRGGRKDTVPRTESAGFAPPSDNERFPQAQTCPEPGGQLGDQDWSNDLAVAPFSPSP
jgi:hypothetical protein